MEQKEVYQIEKGVSEVTINHRTLLPEQRPLRVDIMGTIGAPREFIGKRLMPLVEKMRDVEIDWVDPAQSVVIANLRSGKITIMFNMDDPLHAGEVTGKLVENPEFSKWKINTGQKLDHSELSEFIKMNRHNFANKEVAMKLSKELADVKIKADAQYERKKDQVKGSERFLVSKEIIQSNIPSAFNLTLPFFVGSKKQNFEVEVYVDPSSYNVTLVSPDANETIENYKEFIIEEELDAIRELSPELPIIYQ